MDILQGQAQGQEPCPDVDESDGECCGPSGLIPGLQINLEQLVRKRISRRQLIGRESQPISEA